MASGTCTILGLCPRPIPQLGVCRVKHEASLWGTGLCLVLRQVQRLFINTGQWTRCPWILCFTVVSLTPHISKTKSRSYFSILSPAGVSSACAVWCFLKLWRGTRSCLLSPARCEAGQGVGLGGAELSSIWCLVLGCKSTSCTHFPSLPKQVGFPTILLVLGAGDGHVSKWSRE